MKIWEIIKEDFEGKKPLDEGWKENILATVISVASLFGNVKGQDQASNSNISVNQQVKNDSLKLDMSKLFPSGKYILNPADDAVIKNELRRFGAEILKNPTMDYMLEVVSSESQVTNYDMEKSSPTYGQKLPVGDLAKKRAETINFIFTNFIQEMKKEGALKGEAKFVNPRILIGDVKWPSVNPITNQKRTNADPAYSKDQYVFVNVKIVNGRNVAMTKTDVAKPAIDFKAFSHMGEPIYFNEKHYAMLYYPTRNSNDINQSGNLNTGYQDVLLRVVKIDKPMSGKIDEKGVFLKSYLIPSEWWNKNVQGDRLSEKIVQYINANFEI